MAAPVPLVSQAPRPYRRPPSIFAAKGSTVMPSTLTVSMWLSKSSQAASSSTRWVTRRLKLPPLTDSRSVSNPRARARVSRYWASSRSAAGLPEMFEFTVSKPTMACSSSVQEAGSCSGMRSSVSTQVRSG